MKIPNNILETVEKQFYLDCNISPGCIDPGRKIQVGKKEILSGCRHYEGMDFFFKSIMFFQKGFLMADESIFSWVLNELTDLDPAWFHQFPNLRKIDQKLNEYGFEIADTHLYYLPGPCKEEFPLDFEVRWFSYDEIQKMKGKNPFHKALCYSKTQPDVIAVAAIIDGTMAGMAGASEDGAYLWQIGIDVLPEYEGRGIAVKLTNLLKNEILRRGKIPFYGTSESHSVSRSIAVKAGFLPAWSEIFVRKKEE